MVWPGAFLQQKGLSTAVRVSGVSRTGGVLVAAQGGGSSCRWKDSHGFKTFGVTSVSGRASRLLEQTVPD
jgi:hypothetical protein